MKRRLLLLNVALVALIAAGGYQLRQRWLAAAARERAVAAGRLKALPAPPQEPLRPPEPATGAAYGDVAQKMLFSKDRNPTVVVEVAPPKPMPPLPAAVGVVNFGEGPTAILSEKPGGPHRSYSPGDTVGEFTLLEVSPESIVFEWEGQKITRSLDEIRERPGAGQASAPAPAPSSPQVTSSAVTSVTAAPTKAGPGPVMGGDIRACLPEDTSPSGTVVNGLRKIVTSSPFGKVCRWEPVQ